MRKDSSSIRIVIALAAMSAGAVFPASARAAGRLTALDYIEIQQLVNRLSFTLDYCGQGGRDFAELFTGDGAYVVDDGGTLRTYRGPEQLAGLAGGPDCAVTRTAPRLYLSHVAANLIIEPTAGGAHGISYALYPGRKGKVFQEDAAGQVGLYHDDFVRTPKGWRLTLRRHEVSPEAVAAK